MRQAYYLEWKYGRRWLSVILLPLFGMLAGYAEAGNCKKIGVDRVHCTDIVGLEHKTILIREDFMDVTGKVVFGDIEYCNISYTTNTVDDLSARLRKQYDVRLKGDFRGSDFILSNGGSEIPVTFKWRGGMPVSGGGDWEMPGPSGMTGDQQGAFSCGDKPYSKAWARFEVASSYLQSALPGDYVGSFSVDMGHEGQPYRSAVDFTVRLPPLIRISGLDDMILKARNAADDRYSQEQAFCVFVSGGGDYWIRASGGRVWNEAFELSSGSHAISYDVSLSTDGTNLVSVAPGDWLVSTSGGSSSLNCNGGTNSKVRVVVLDSEVVGKPTGAYSGTLYITAEPG